MMDNIYLRWEIFCDGCGGSTFADIGLTRDQAEQEFQSAGWTKDGQCSECAASLEKLSTAGIEGAKAGSGLRQQLTKEKS